MDVRMQDGTVIKNVPPGITKAQLTARLNASKNKTGTVSANDAPKSDSIFETAIRGAAQGATFGFADEIAAGVDALTQPLTGRGSSATSIGERYDQNLIAERARDRANAEANPVTDIAANIGGSILGPGKLVKGAKDAISIIRQGAGMGALYGFGQGEGGLAERGKSAAEGAAIGGITGGALGGATKLYNKVRPSNVSANYTNKQFAKSPMAAESEKLSTELGQTYTPGQATGSRSLLTLEGLVRRHPTSADTMAEFDAKQLDTSLKNLVQNLDKLSANPAGPAATGIAVNKAFDDVLAKAVTTRRGRASQDFAEVDKLVNAEKDRLSTEAFRKYDADVAAVKALREQDAATRAASIEKQRRAGGAIMSPQMPSRPMPEPPSETKRLGIVTPKNLTAAIDEIVESFSAPGGGDASAALVARAQRLKNSLPKDGERLTATQTQRLLQIYGQASAGTGEIFKDLDKAQQRLIAGRLQNALLDDVTDAAEGMGQASAIAKALTTARDNYRSNSKAINELEKSVLGRLFGGDYDKAPERVAQTIKNMQPTELRTSLSILDKSDPATSQAVKRYLVEDALSTAGVNPRSGAPQPQVGGEDTFSPAKFLTAIRKSNVWGAFTPEERKGMETAVRDLERISFRAGTDGSPTAPLQFAWELAKAMGGGAMALSPTQVAKSAATVLVPQKIAKVITTPEGQRALRTVRTSKPNSPASLAATSVLVGMFTSKDGETEKGGPK